MLATLALSVGSKRTANIGAFLPVDSQPAQVFDHRQGVVGARALWIKVLIPEHEYTAALSCAFICDPEGPPVSRVQIAGRRGSQSSAVGGSFVCHGCSICTSVPSQPEHPCRERT